MKKLLILLAFLTLDTMLMAGQQCPKVTNTAVVNATSNGDNTIVAADTSRRIIVWQFYIVNSHATQDENLTWKAGSTAVSGAYLLKAAGGSHTGICTGTAWFVVPVGSALVLNESAAGTITGQIYYSLE